jgi:hypothetical protein
MYRNNLEQTSVFALVAARTAIAFPIGWTSQLPRWGIVLQLQFALPNATKERQCQ